MALKKNTHASLVNIDPDSLMLMLALGKINKAAEKVKCNFQEDTCSFKQLYGIFFIPMTSKSVCKSSLCFCVKNYFGKGHSLTYTVYCCVGYIYLCGCHY